MKSAKLITFFKSNFNITMKNKFVIVALAAMALASCAKEQNANTSDEQQARVTINLKGVASAKTRAIEAPGVETEGTIILTNGQIFVLSPAGAVEYTEPLDIADAAEDGENYQILGQDVASDSRIYIVGNIPAENTTLVDATSLTQIKLESAAITDQEDYTAVALANVDGEPILIEVTKEIETEENLATIEAEANVTIEPVISRIELGKVTGSEEIAGFTVAGVYVDDWYSEFTFGGSYAGDLYVQGTEKVFPSTAAVTAGFTTFLGDAADEEGEWDATSADATDLATNPFFAIPAEDMVWANNVNAGNLPRLIIKLTDVVFLVDEDLDPLTDPTEQPQEDDLYLTVTGYTVNSTAISTFEAGNIYSIGGGVDGSGITFGPGDTSLEPNTGEVTLEVNVDIKEWVVVDADAEL
jgi:hypothetical protein